MEYQPKVSIIVPVYNSENTLCKCIESILAQLFSDYELLLINDGSTDRSREICDDYVKRFDKIRVVHKINGGVSSARNVGIMHAVGEWICFVDADDTVSPDWLSGFIGYNKHPDLITHPVLLIHPNGNIQKMTYCTNNKSIEESIWDLYENHLLGFVWSMFYNRRTIVKNSLRFDERLQSGEDLEFMSRYSSYVNQIDNFFVGYYVYTFPKTKKTYGKIRNVYFLIYSNLFNFFKSQCIKNKFISVIAPHLIYYILNAYSWNENEVASKCIKYYRDNVPSPFILVSGGKVVLLSNIFIKLNMNTMLFVLSKIFVPKKYGLGFEYIDL